MTLPLEAVHVWFCHTKKTCRRCKVCTVCAQKQDIYRLLPMPISRLVLAQCALKTLSKDQLNLLLSWSRTDKEHVHFHEWTLNKVPKTCNVLCSLLRMDYRFNLMFWGQSGLFIYHKKNTEHFKFKPILQVLFLACLLLNFPTLQRSYSNIK